MEMVMRKAAIVGFLLLAAAFVGCKAQMMLCKAPVSGLIACEPAVKGAQPPMPTEACCSALAKANMTCLCSYKGELAGYGIDMNKAMALPGKCKLPPPPKC